ncbi:uncharacterized protein F5Z01DRAFT_657237 [Emericellopsis atlantica]|uniref:FAD-binding domain-containing protein n=1 Tax=Emericellopsis atlantica TaxID=2614577 RepID=A0A9P7ZJV6_9HYPO|nr:uncharacterized protein F5Z01DRAFT_657237 [Emericellopsis atlantica]KAG9253449.1 hypothetical protein F5Z01DRAFT_657237 [Emericellopsis atlantica]
MSNLRVLVVGASIAGPSTAYWLAKAGAKVTVIERFPELRKGGQAIDIRTVGVTTMRKMGDMEAQVQANKAPIEGLAFVRENGRPYGVIGSTGDSDQQSLLSEYEIFRGDLSRILYDKTNDNPNISYVFGEQIASLQHDEKNNGPIKVGFANRLPPAEYDLVVACDGATSRTRALGLGIGLRDHTRRLNIWAAYFSTKHDYVDGSKIGHAYNAAPGKVVAVQTAPEHEGGNRVVVMRMFPRDGKDHTLPFRDAQQAGDEVLKKHVREELDGMGWIVPQLMREDMDAADDFYASEWIQVNPPTLSKGRFTMVGDAGYGGAPGAGTSLALAGGYVLAGELSQSRGDVAAGLKAYEDRIRPIFEDMHKLPPGGVSFMAPQTKWGLALRNFFFAFLARSGLITFMQKVWGRFEGAFASSDKYPLPDYKFDGRL